MRKITMPAPYTFSIPLFSLKQQTRSGKFWTAWDACLLREVYFHILMSPFSIGGIQTSGYPGQDSQHPAAKLCSSQWPMGFHQAFFCWLEKKKKKPNCRLHFSTALCKHWFQCFPVLLLGCPVSHCKSSHRSQQDASCWQALRAWRLCICSETDK